MKVVIDTDAGLDDTQAILMVLAHPEIEIRCITTVCGNTTVSNCTRNVVRILQAANKSKIPVHEGCENPLIGLHIPPSFYHGRDGFGDNTSFEEVDLSNVQKEHAVIKLINESKEYEGELVVIALGPLTNIAMSIRLDPGFARRLKGLYAMGGNFHGIGNSLPHGEFNFAYDPESAKIVLHELKCPITLACWELCLNSKATWTWRSNDLGKKESKCIEIINKAEYDLRKRYYNNSNEYIFADQLIAGIFLHPDIVTSSEELPCTVAVDGLTKGMMVVDRRMLQEKDENREWPMINIVTSVDSDKLMSNIVADLHSLP